MVSGRFGYKQGRQMTWWQIIIVIIVTTACGMALIDKWKGKK